MVTGSLRALCGNRRGSTALEAALVLPMLGLAMFAVLDIAMGFSAKLKLVQAASRTVELATAPGTVGSDYTYLQGEAATASGQPVANVTVSNWLECGTVRQANTTVICGSGAQISRYVSVRITGVYTSKFRFGRAASGTIRVPIAGSATVRLQ